MQVVTCSSKVLPTAPKLTLYLLVTPSFKLEVVCFQLNDISSGSKSESSAYEISSSMICSNTSNLKYSEPTFVLTWPMFSKYVLKFWGLTAKIVCTLYSAYLRNSKCIKKLEQIQELSYLMKLLSSV